MIDCSNQFGFVFDSRLHDLLLLVTEDFSTMYFSSLWRTDTIVFAKLNKHPLSNESPVSIKTPSPPPQMCLKKLAPWRGLIIEDLRCVDASLLALAKSLYIKLYKKLKLPLLK